MEFLIAQNDDPELLEWLAKAEKEVKQEIKDRVR